MGCCSARFLAVSIKIMRRVSAHPKMNALHFDICLQCILDDFMDRDPCFSC